MIKIYHHPNLKSFEKNNPEFLFLSVFLLQIMSDYSADYIKEKLAKELETEHIEVEDLSDGCGGKFQALIVSSKFEGLPLLKRHRLVNSVLEEEMKTIHAFTQKTLTPEQWRAKNNYA